VGSFPSILKFDSLGQHFLLHNSVLITLNTFVFVFLRVFKQRDIEQNKMRIYFIKNNFKTNTTVFKKKFNFIFSNIFLKNIILLLSNLFFLGVNFLLLDDNYNYNYLPVSNYYLKKKFFYKTIKYFNVKVLFFFDVKPRILKNFLDFNLMNITTYSSVINIDFFSKLKDLKIFHYILYVFVLSMYINK
jgi:hypothetical protein